MHITDKALTVDETSIQNIIFIDHVIAIVWTAKKPRCIVASEISCKEEQTAMKTEPFPPSPEE